jgi:hypothetical protein
VDKKPVFISFWGDTVEQRELYVGIIFSAIASYAVFYGGKAYLTTNFAHIGKNLIAGYSLFLGLVTTVVVAVIIAKFFKPKRIFHDDECNFDKERFIQEYHIDLEQEALYLKDSSPEIIQELKQLGLYTIFAEKGK